MAGHDRRTAQRRRDITPAWPKWHLGNNAGQRPEDRAFHRVFSFLGGGVSHFSDAKALAPSEQPHTLYDDDGKDVTNDLPDDFYSTTYYTDKMIEFRGPSRKTSRLQRSGLHRTARPAAGPRRMVGSLQGRLRWRLSCHEKGRTLRMKVPRTYQAGHGEINPGTDHFEQWEDLSGNEQRIQARKMGNLRCDDRIDGRGSRESRRTSNRGEYDNTLILFMSDNGANPRIRIPIGLTADEMDELFDNKDNLGRVGSSISIGDAWAEACNTPLSYYKYTTSEGGVQAPLS